MKSTVLREDLYLLANADISWKQFHKCTFLVTGATGLLGSLFVRTLLSANRLHGLGLQIVMPVRDPEKARNIFGDEEDLSPLHILRADLNQPLAIKETIDYILHAAAITRSKTMADHPTEVIRTAVNGMEHVLDVAREKKVRKMVFLSSMEVYGQMGEKPAGEGELGWLDLTNPRSSYPESKRMCEVMATAWAAEYGVPVCSARLAQAFGPGILEGENRVFAQFARSAVNREDIVLHTKGLSEGNYCYTRDAMYALLLLFLKGEAGQAYNIANEETHTTIRSMAETVAEKSAAGKIRVILDLPEDAATLGYAPDVKLRLDASKMRSLGWEPEVGLEEMYRRLIAEMREKEKIGNR